MAGGGVAGSVAGGLQVQLQWAGQVPSLPVYIISVII